MKFLVVLAVAVACAAADVSHLVGNPDAVVPIVRSAYDISPDGNSYQYAYETGNGISAQAEGSLDQSDSDAPAIAVRGSYRYTAPDGSVIDTSYVSDKNGYRPTGSSIPEIPEAILRSLAYIAANKPYVEPSKPAYAETYKPVYKP